jgi:glycerate dehydrogenase
MNIVVLDGYTLNPGDLDWTDLESLGSLTVYDRTDREHVVRRASEAEIVLTNKTLISAQTFDALPELTYVGVLATGYNVVDIEAARSKQITVTNVPTYGTTAVAQMVFAHLLEHCHHVKDHSEAVHQGAWQNQPDFCFWHYPLFELAGRTMGIIGFGRIGRAVAAIASSFGMPVRAADTNRTAPPESIEDFGWLEVDEIFEQSDVISLNCPLFPETEGLVNASRLARMKPNAILINASRGGLVVDQDLADALNEERIAGASLDVVSNVEPPAADNPLLQAKHCFITPHIAWATREARQRLMTVAVENVKAFLQGTPRNVVNGTL